MQQKAKSLLNETHHEGKTAKTIRRHNDVLSILGTMSLEKSFDSVPIDVKVAEKIPGKIQQQVAQSAR